MKYIREGNGYEYGGAATSHFPFLQSSSTILSLSQVGELPVAFGQVSPFSMSLFFPAWLSLT